MCQDDFGQFLLNTIRFTSVVIWQYISETKPVVEYAEHHSHAAPLLFQETDCQFVVVVAYGLILTPGLRPCLILRIPAHTFHLHMRAYLFIIKKETQTGGADQWAVLVVDHVEWMLVLHADGHRHGSVG